MTAEKHRNCVHCPSMHHMNTFTSEKLYSREVKHGTRGGREGEQRKKGLKMEGMKMKGGWEWDVNSFGVS